MSRLRLLFSLLLAAAWGLRLAAAPAVASPLAQDQGLAVITSPLEGAGAAGVLPISGTATHPEFERYELSFAYSPNPTDTWFPIAPRGTAPVVNELLGRWDTSQISDGVYTLRLRVFYGEGAFLEAIVGSVRVQNATPTPPLGPGTEPGPSPTPQLPATATQPVIVLPPTATPRATTVAALPGDGNAGPGPNVPPNDGAGDGPRISGGLVGLAFAAGVRLTLISFLLLAAYVSLKAALRARPRR
jgi:hypothetical protein